MRSPFRFYEGSTKITGTVNKVKVKGVGFVELLHSYEKPELKILNNSLWNPAIPFQWEVINPDDGNPLTYKLEYSTDDQETFQPIASDLTKTVYIWSPKTLSNGTKFRLKITGKSIDGTLKANVTKEFVYSVDK